MTLLSQLIALVIALTLHEFAHALVGYWLGDDTAKAQGRLSLNPAKHIDPVATLLLPLFLIIVHSPVIFGAAKPVPFNPWMVRWGRLGSALIAFAGPATNFLIAIVVGLYLRFVHIGVTGYEMLGWIVAINITIGLFNLIPFPPLDGSRLLYAVVPYRAREVMDTIERSGLVAIFLFLFVAYPFIAPIMGRATAALIAILIPGNGLP
jgi:Zn-dependent protease